MAELGVLRFKRLKEVVIRNFWVLNMRLAFFLVVNLFLLWENCFPASVWKKIRYFLSRVALVGYCSMVEISKI